MFQLLQANQNVAIFKQLGSELKFICSEKAIKFCEISTIDLSYLYVVMVKSMEEITQKDQIILASGREISGFQMT